MAAARAAARLPKYFIVNWSPPCLGASDGRRASRPSEWRANLSTSYRLAGLTEQKHLKRMSVGGALRWEDRGAIGYNGIPVNGDVGQAVTYDKTRPIWAPANIYVDAFITYNVRLFSDKVRARFQLNGRNLQESGGLRAIGAYPDGRTHSFRIVNPRTFIFTDIRSVDGHARLAWRWRLKTPFYRARPCVPLSPS